MVAPRTLPDPVGSHPDSAECRNQSRSSVTKTCEMSKPVLEQYTRRSFPMASKALLDEAATTPPTSDAGRALRSSSVMP